MSIPSLLLTGLDGSNPLAFLAALGTLRVLTVAMPNDEVKMSWEQDRSAWRPRITGIESADALVALLGKTLVRDRNKHATYFVGNSTAIDAFFTLISKGQLPADHLDSWVSALISDIHPRATSQLQLTRRDYFPGNLDQIITNTQENHLRSALFDVWRYDDKLDGQSLHIEPTEDRRHAYQWYKPNGDPNRKLAGNVLGANRMAIEALPLFLAFPSKNPDRLLVAGWTGVRSDNSRWTWPIWSPQIGLSTVQSLIALNTLQKEILDVRDLRARGIVATYRCRRILVEQTPNLTPAVMIG